MGKDDWVDTRRVDEVLGNEEALWGMLDVGYDEEEEIEEEEQEELWD